MTWGFMARSTMGMPAALGQPSSTSVRGPTSIWGTPRQVTATSPRSSTRATRRGGQPSPAERQRTRSRKSVVLPPPGGESSSVLWKVSRSKRLDTKAAAMPRHSRPMRTDTALRSRRPVTTPSRMMAVPHRPTRNPPRTDKYPARAASAAA